MPQMTLEPLGKEWLEPALRSFGTPSPSSKSFGGWELAVSGPASSSMPMSGTLRATDAAYRSLLGKPILKKQPKLAPGQVKVSQLPKPSKQKVMLRVPAFWRVRTASGAIDQALDSYTSMVLERQLKDAGDEQRKRRHKEDEELVLKASAAAQVAAVRAAVQVKKRTMRKVRSGPRVRIFGMSRKKA